MTHNHDPLISEVLAELDRADKAEAAAGFATTEAAARKALSTVAASFLARARCRQHSDAIRKALLSLARALQPNPPIMPVEEVKRFELKELWRWNYRGGEQERLIQSLRQNEIIIAIEPRRVITCNREIPRESLKPLRMAWETNAAYEAVLALNTPSEEELSDYDKVVEQDKRFEEEARKNAERSVRNSEIAAERMEAARIRQAELAEDFYLAMVERAKARHGINS